MKRLIAESYMLLVNVELLMRIHDLQAVHSLVRKSKVSNPRGHAEVSAQDLCRSIDLACVLYIKRVLCLQRSAASTILLRRHGYRAEMVIGARMLPFKSHAWVEVDGVIVNDKPYMGDIYRVLERC
jgi:hypothetical protein